MTEARIRLLIGAAGVLGGGAVGFWIAASMPAAGQAAGPTDPVPVQRAAEASPVPRDDERALVCSRGGPDDLGRLRTRWCEAQLAEHARRARMVRSPWPDDLGPEEPTAWAATMEALSACDLPFRIETVECTEYPCLATVRWQGEDDPEAWRPPEDCAPLDAFDGVGLQRATVRCPDGRVEDVVALYAGNEATWERVLDDRLPAGVGSDSLRALTEHFRVFGRRLDDVMTTHGCEDG
jgi:hypothetical protein